MRTSLYITVPLILLLYNITVYPMNHWKPHWTDLDSVFCAGETHAIHLCGVVFGVPAICDGTSTGPPAMSAQPMLPVPQRGNDLNEALSSFSDPSEVGHIWWLYLVVVLVVVLGDSCYSTSITACSLFGMLRLQLQIYGQQKLKPGGDEEDSPSLAFKRLQELEARDRRFRDKFPRCTIDIH